MDTQREIIIERNGPCSMWASSTACSRKKNTTPSRFTHTCMAVPHAFASTAIIGVDDSLVRFQSSIRFILRSGPTGLDSTLRARGIDFLQHTHTNAFL